MAFGAPKLNDFNGAGNRVRTGDPQLGKLYFSRAGPRSQRRIADGIAGFLFSARAACASMYRRMIFDSFLARAILITRTGNDIV